MFYFFVEIKVEMPTGSRTNYINSGEAFLHMSLLAYNMKKGILFIVMLYMRTSHRHEERIPEIRLVNVM